MFSRVIRMSKLEMPVWGRFWDQTSNTYWAEVTALALGIPLMKLAFNLPDPFFLQTAFPWLLLPLLLIALRYGTVVAMAGFGMLLGGVMLYWLQTAGVVPNAAHLQQLAGMSIILLLVGELAGNWRQRYQEEQQRVHSLRSDMHTVERELQVLQVSHAQLEEELLGVGHSLKRSLDTLRNTLPANLSPARQRVWLADKMMEILSAYDWLEVAAFLAVDENQKINAQPLAQKGNIGVSLRGDRLLHEALRTQKPVGFKREVYLTNTVNTLGSALIAVLPVLDKNGQMQMVLAVRHIQFAAYTQKNLNLLATLCNWLGNLLPVKTLARPQNTLLSDISGLSGVVDEIHATLNLLMENKRSLALLGVNLPPSNQTPHYMDYFAGLTYGSNRLWQVRQGGRTILIIALPLSNPERFARYQQGVESNFHHRFDQTLSQVGIGLTAHHIRRSPNKQQLIEYLRSVK